MTRKKIKTPPKAKNVQKKSKTDEEADHFIEPKITYFELRRLVNEYRIKYRSTNNLLFEIKKRTNHTIDTPKLLKIAGEKKVKDTEVTFNLRDLKALNAIFDDDDKLTNTSILTEEVDLLNVFAAEQNMDFFVPAFFNEEATTYVSNRFHIRSFEVVQDNLRHIFVQYRDAVNRKEKNAQPRINDYLRYCEWYDSINDKRDCVRLCCGNMFLSPAMEIILAEKIFNVKPYENLQRFNAKEKEKLLPFYVCYPDVKIDRIGINNSAFNMSPSVALQIVEEDNKKEAKETLENKRCIIINRKIYASDRREDIDKNDRHTNYGAFILRLNKPHEDNKKATSSAFGCIFGSYAPVNLGIAERLFSGKYKNPFIVPSLRTLTTPHVLIVIIKTVIGVRKVIKNQFEGQKIPKDVEWREIKEIDIVDSYLYEYEIDNDIWKIKEQLTKANDESKYFREIDDSDRYIKDLVLY